MIRYPYLISECNVDTAFVEMLGYVEPNHAPNIQQVCLMMQNSKTNATYIGFIDNDKKKPSYISSFKLLDESKYFRILRHETKNQFLVVAIPAMDKVIYELCQELQISPSKYKLPGDFKGFLSLTKKLTIAANKDFKQLLNAIKQKNPEEVTMVKSLVSNYY